MIAYKDQYVHRCKNKVYIYSTQVIFLHSVAILFSASIFKYENKLTDKYLFIHLLKLNKLFNFGRFLLLKCFFY